MSQNKFMHPRNIYKKPPNFKQLAIKYPEFRKVAKQDLSGKVTIDFKNQEALRALTCALLQDDFDLDVRIPLNRLIPTVPLRLNYLLWIEDLLNITKTIHTSAAPVRGIDVGTGASCIYPLLAAKQYSWHMVASEIDPESVDIARQNVIHNSLQELITVKLVDGSTMLKHFTENGQTYAFCMCNPPFFSSEHELDSTQKSRSFSRTPPHNAFTGDMKELISPGGEIAFILKLIHESKEIKTSIKIYSTMVGQKSSLAVLREHLQQMNVCSMTETRFCQGNTTRWGIAWTFEENMPINKVQVQIPSQKKSHVPMSFVISHDDSEKSEYTVKYTTKVICDIWKELQVKFKIKKQNEHLTVMDITASTNTWSHQRKKKRIAQRTEKQRCNETLSSASSQNDDCSMEHPHPQGITNTEEIPNSQDVKDMNKRSYDDGTLNHGAAKKQKLDQSSNDSKEESANILDEANKCKDNNCSKEMESKDATSHDGEPVPQHLSGKFSDVKYELKSNKQTGHKTIPVLEAILCIRNVASETCLEMLWNGGTGGKDAVHQVMQYIKNKVTLHKK